jgi:hypothetical protein
MITITVNSGKINQAECPEILFKYWGTPPQGGSKGVLLKSTSGREVKLVNTFGRIRLIRASSSRRGEDRQNWQMRYILALTALQARRGKLRILPDEAMSFPTMEKIIRA